MDEILKYYHSNVSYFAVLFGGTVNNAVQGGSYLFYLWKKTLNFKCDDSSEGYAFEASFTAFSAVKPHISPT